MRLAHKRERFINYMVDNIIVLTAFLATIVIFNLSPPLDYPVAAVIHVCYFYYCESKKGRTTGKMATGTRLIHRRVMPFDVILVRSIFRLFPLDALSCLMGTEKGIYDWFPGILVVKNVMSPVKGQDL